MTIALRTSANLEVWQPKRERRPHKHRRLEPDLGVVATALTQVSIDRATLEATVTVLATVVIQSVGSLSEEQLQEASQALSCIVLTPESERTP